MKKCPHIYVLIASIFTLCIIFLSSFINNGDNAVIKGLGIIFLIFTPGLWIFPVIHFKKYGKSQKGKKFYDTNVFVDKGVYSIVRHPQYLAYIFLVIGFSFLTQHLLIVIFSIVAILFFYLHSITEERQLIEKFGIKYSNYCRNVPRFNFIKGSIKKLKSG